MTAMASPPPKQPTPEQEAANENTSQQRLRELARVSTLLAQIVAKNPHAAPDLLQELGASSDETTREAVAANPNTPTELLWELGEEFPEQVLDNPIFSLLLLENPNLLADMPVATLESLVTIDAVPESFLLWAASHTDAWVLLAVAMNPNTPKSVLKKLTQSDDFDVAQAAKLHVNWAGEMSEGWDEVALGAMKFTCRTRGMYRIDQYRNSENEKQLWEVGAISEELLPALDEGALSAIAENPETSEHILKVLREISPPCIDHYDVYLALNPQCPLSILEALVGSKSKRCRKLAAENPNTPFALLQQFQLQLGLVKHPHTDSDTLRELATSQWKYIRLGVAGHLNTPQNALEKLALDPDYDLYKAVALNKNTSTRALEQRATDKDSELLQAIACHPHVSADVLEQLATDYWFTYWFSWVKDMFLDLVEKNLDFNPNIPTSLLKELATDPDCENLFLGGNLFLTGNVWHPLTDSETLRELGMSQLEYIRFCVAGHPKAPQDVLEKLTLDQDNRVRMAVALNKNTPTRALERLVTDGDIQMLQAIACHPHTSAKVLKQLAAVPKDDFYQIREVVALNPNTPTSLVEELVLDPAVCSFSMSLAQNPNTPVSVLEQLTKYPDVQVQRCAQSTLQLGSKLKNHSADCIEATPALYTSWLASKFPNSREITDSLYYDVLDDYNSLLDKLPSTDKPSLLGCQIAAFLNRSNRRLIALNPATPFDTLQHIAFNDEERWIREAAITTLTQNANTPGEILQQLVEKAYSDGEVYWFYWFSGVALATHPNAPIAALEKLAKSDFWQARLVVAKNPNTPATALEKLARDDNWKVRKVVAQNSHTPPSALEELLQDKNKYVRAAAITNPNTPKNLQQQIEQLNNPEISQNRLAELATSQWLIIRERVASHPNTSVSLLEELATDEKSAVRGAVAQNPHTPENILERLLAEDKNREVRIAVAANPNTPISILEKIAQKKTRNKQLQRAAKKNIFSRYPDKLAAFLEKFIKSNNSNNEAFTRMLVFSNPLAPSESLAKNFRSWLWLEKYAIAQNSNTPPDPLKFLAQDSNRIVRAAARANLQQRSLV